MNAQSIFSRLAILLVLLAAACAPAATPTMIANEPLTAPAEQAASPLPTRAPEIYVEPAATAAAPAPAGMGDNYFQDYGVNPLTDTNRDHLSTFAIDVDTASYAVTRRYINDGALPPIDAVRAEEFINAFDQGYAPPRDSAFAIYADGAPAPFSDQPGYLLRIGIQGYQVPEEVRKPANLTFVIDISGSMNMENRLGLVKRSLNLLVERLQPADTVAIVVYGSDAYAVLEPTAGSQRRAIQRAINRLQTEGATNAEQGLRLGYEYAMRMYQPEETNRVILCSDGVANVGTTSADGILEFVGGFVDEGIDLTTVGFGMGNFNDVLLEQLADRGNGAYHYVDTLEEARKLFVEDLTSTLEVIAYDAKVQVDFNPEIVENYRLVGYENRAVADDDFRNDAVDAGEIGAGHTITALYEVQLYEGSEGRIGTVQLRWQDADTRAVREINGNFNTWDLAAQFSETDPHFQLTAAVAAYAEVLRASPYVNASLNEILRVSQRAARMLPENEQANEFVDLVRRSTSLR